MNDDLVLHMEDNLLRVWGEKNTSDRMKYIQSIYTTDSILFLGYQISGHTAINECVNTILTNMPSNFNFYQLNPVIINNNVGRLIWGVGKSRESIIATGMDIAFFENGKIKYQYVFLD